MPFGFVAEAIPVIAGAAGAASSISNLVGGGSSGDATHAAQTQANAADAATNLQRDVFNQTTANFQPFLNAGQNTLPQLLQYLGIGGGAGGTFDPNAPGVAPFKFDPSSVANDPAYQFQLGQGKEAILNNAASKGGVNSGNTLKQLTQFGQGLASNDYWNQYNAYTQQQQNIIKNLGGVVGSGQNAAGNMATAGTVYGNQAGSNLIGAGNALAAGQVASGNSAGAGLGQLLGGLGGGSSSGGSMNQLAQLLAGLSGGSSGGGGMDFGSTLPLSFGGSSVPSLG